MKSNAPKSKAPKSEPTKQARAAPARSTASYGVVGTTGDGVRILRGKVKPTHFTSKEIRATIRRIKAVADKRRPS